MNDPRRILPVLTLLLGLSACSNDTTRPVQREPEADGFEIEVIDSPSGPTNIRDVFFVSTMQGVEVTYGGDIGVTADGGYTWDMPDTGTEHPLRSVWFTSNRVGYVVGGTSSEAVILKTTDGGVSWSRRASPVPAELHGVHFPNESDGFIAGLGYVLATSDGGETWEIRLEFKGLLKGVHFVDDHTGLAYGIRGTILKTTDGGVTWTDASLPDEGFVYDVDFNEGLGVACQGRRVLKSVDVGDTWTEVGEFVSIVYQADVLDSTTIVAVGQGAQEGEWIFYGALHVSQDGGESWLSDDHAAHLQAVHCPGPKLAVAAASRRLLKIYFR